MAGAAHLEKCLSLLKNLLPGGALWEVENQPNLKALLTAFAQEFCRAEDRVEAMLNEADPRITDELLEDWERLLGLPDECSPPIQTEQERRNAILAKLTNVGGLSGDFLEFIGAQMGVTITVRDYEPFLAGKSRAGDPLTNPFDDRFLAGDRCGDRLRIAGWRFFFDVELPVANPLLECTIRKLKPAHTGVTFTIP